MVVAFHAGLPVPGGFVGVDVFFVISGFVITGMLLREQAATGRIRMRRFYVLRFKRLTPALALMVSVTMILSALLLPPLEPQRTAAETALGAMLLVANFVIARSTGGYFDAPAEWNPLLNTWSLSVEEQFYLVFPALLVVAWALSRRHRSLRWAPGVIVGGVAACSFVVATRGSLVGRLPQAADALGFYGPLTRAWEFAVGALLALLVLRLPSVGGRRALASGVFGAALVVAGAWTIDAGTQVPGPMLLLPVGGALLLLLPTAGGASPVARVLATRPFVTVGGWSYSIYLWHWPLIVFARLQWPDDTRATVAAALLSLAPAIGSYALVEQPIRSLPSPGRRRLGVLVAATLVPSISLALVLGWSGTRLVPDRVEAFSRELTTPRIASRHGCFSTGPYTDARAAACTWGEGPGAPVYLVGDSNAWHFGEAIVEAGHALGRPVSIQAAWSCPLVEGLTITFVRPGTFRDDFDADGTAHCDDFVRFTLSRLRHAPQGTVILAMADWYWFDESFSASLAGGKPTADPEEKVRIFERGLASTVERLRRAGQRVLLVQAIPTYRTSSRLWDPRGCTTLSIADGGCERHAAVTDVDELQAPSRHAVERVARESGVGTAVLDLRGELCDARRCSTSAEGVNLYQDSSHLTARASSALAGRFTRAIGSLGGD